jgi:hypothetical protein
MYKKPVFISYDHSEDYRYKFLLSAWDANSNFDFEFDNRSPGVAINSTNAGVIKAALTKMMMNAEYLLVIVGEKTHTSHWVSWEIERAKQSDTKLKLAAVKIKREFITPSGLLNVGTAWAYSFTREGILDALDRANNNYLMNTLLRRRF